MQTNIQIYSIFHTSASRWIDKQTDDERTDRKTHIQASELVDRNLPSFSLSVPSSLEILSAVDTVVVDFDVLYVRVERPVGHPTLSLLEFSR